MRQHPPHILLFASAPFLAACPSDLTESPAGGTEGTTTSGQPTSVADVTTGADSSGPGDDTAADSTGGGEPPPPPPATTVNCSQLHSPLAGMSVAANSFPVTFAAPCDEIDEIWVWEPEDPSTGLPVTDGRPWVLLQHGAGQSPIHYAHIVDELVGAGFVVFGPNGGQGSSGNARRDEVLCALEWATEEYTPPDGELGECFSMIGHSNGAEGAALAAASLAASHDPLADRLAALVAIAPANTNDLSLAAERSPPTLVLVGTHDHDTGQGGLRQYEVMANEGALDQASDRPGSHPSWVGEKVLVEAFDTSHNSFGGYIDTGPDPVRPEIGDDDMLAKGRAIASAYVPPFLYWQMFDDETYRPRFADNIHPDGLNIGEWWSYLPQSSGTPLIHTAYQMGNRRDIGIERLAVDTFEGEDGSNPYAGEGNRSPNGVATEVGLDLDLLIGDGLGASTRNHALRVDWNPGQSGTIRWDSFGPLEFTPNYLSIRVQNVFDGLAVDWPSCIANSTEEELSLNLRVRSLDENGTEGVLGTRYENVIIQDHSYTNEALDTCDNVHSLYTLRVPLSCMAEESGTFSAANINMIDLEFGAPNDGGGSLLIDSIELTYSPEEPTPTPETPDLPDCSHLTATAGAFAPSFLCHGYDPANQITFTAGAGGPSDPIGEVTFNGAFGTFVAGRPYVLTECDDARYELASVSVDKDSDGTADESHDVRSFESVSPTDLISLLGLEDGDAAITINEPGKPSENGVELYNWDSFLAAQQRFGAMQDLEVRFLREQTTGEHRPELLVADVPPELTGVEAPEPPNSPFAYSLPSGATTVSNASDLVDELALPGGHDIILADGNYAWTGPVTVAGPHRLWSETLHGATLSFGLTYAGNADRTGGMELHGLDFALDDASMAPFGVGASHVIFTWGQGGEDVLIEDCAFDGDLTIGDAIGSFAPNGLVVRRSTIDNFWSHGIVAKQGAAGTILVSEPLLEDLTIRSIFDTTPGASGGARENGILLGNNATIARVHIRDVGWSAIQLYNDATGVSIEDAFIDYAGPTVWDTSYTTSRGAGIWLAESHDVMIDRIRIESHTFLGINAHWDQGNPDPFSNTTPPRNYGIEIANLYSRAFKIGVHLDLGVEDTLIHNARFEHAWMAGVLDNNRFEDDWGTHPCASGESVCLESTNRTEAINCDLQDDVDCVAHHHHGGSTTPPPTEWAAHPDSYVQPGGSWNRSEAALPGPGGGSGADTGTSGAAADNTGN